MEESMLSVGIDIGTSTTSMVVSTLKVQNTASCFAVPRVAITGSEIIYRGEIYPTPQESGEKIDVQAVSALLQREYEKAGICPAQVQTGAVIITGESSRKQNAALVTEKMSGLAGEFVVATAGPDLESIIAAKGAGAQDYSKEHGCTVANLDIGGGTTNVAVFHNGQLIGKGCWDIGGRLVRVCDGRMTYVSPCIGAVADSLGISLREGDAADVKTLEQVTRRMASLLAEGVGLLTPTPLCRQVATAGATALSLAHPVQRVSFSGGVADYVYHPAQDWFRHGDIGPLLAQSVRESALFHQLQVIPAKETIRATVIGAGAYTTTVSGSTITYSDEACFPLKNIPIFTPDEAAETDALHGKPERLCQQAAWMLQESASNLFFYFERITLPSYREITTLAASLSAAAALLPKELPLLVLTEGDFAKVLGQALRRRLPDRPVICIDSIKASTGDYLDLGRPLMNGLVIPVVVKTLIFG